MRCGYVWAATADATLAEVNHPETTVYSLPDDVEVADVEVINPLMVPQGVLRSANPKA